MKISDLIPFSKPNLLRTGNTPEWIFDRVMSDEIVMLHVSESEKSNNNTWMVTDSDAKLSMKYEVYKKKYITTSELFPGGEYTIKHYMKGIITFHDDRQFIPEYIEELLSYSDGRDGEIYEIYDRWIPIDIWHQLECRMDKGGVRMTVDAVIINSGAVKVRGIIILDEQKVRLRNSFDYN